MSKLSDEQVENPKLYYHFSGPTLRDGLPLPAVGEWLILPKQVRLKACPSSKDIAAGFGGLHASAHPYDALRYAPGSLLHLVELDGRILKHGSPVDKVAARKRKIIASLDAEPLLWEYARRCALDVSHLWNAPDVVRQYLTTGDESLRAGARAAAAEAAADAAAIWEAARAAEAAATATATWEAARAAAGTATWAAAAARAATWEAARAAARAAAAAKAAAWEAAGTATWAAAAARAAAGNAAAEAAAEAAADAAADRHRTLLAGLVEAAFAKQRKPLVIVAKEEK